MIDKICDYLTEKIRKEQPDIDNEKAEIINYGIHLIVGEIPKFFIIMGISYLLGTLKLSLLIYFILMPYRGASGGFHLKSHLGCIVGTTVFYNGIVMMAKYLTLTQNIKYVVAFLVWLFGIIMIRLYAPADTENVPIISKKERKNKQILSYVTLTISIIIAILINNNSISSLIIYAMLFQTITITRMAYKITNNKYGYEVYEN